MENGTRLSGNEEPNTSESHVISAKSSTHHRPSLEELIPVAATHDHEAIVRTLRRAGLIKDHRLAEGRLMRSALRGEDLVTWLVREKRVRRNYALEVGQQLVSRYFSTPGKSEVVFNTGEYYRLEGDEVEDPMKPLNAPSKRPSMGPYSQVSVTDLASFNDLLCPLLQSIFSAVLSPNGRCVYYELLEGNGDFLAYLSLIRQAVHLRDIESAGREARLAFYINVYNAMRLHVVHKYGVAASVWERRKHNCSVYMQLGTHLFSLQSIFDGILRGNRRGRDAIWEPFGAEDPRLKFAISGCEPLVHFACDTGTLHSPPIRAYSTTGVMGELLENARCSLQSEDFLRLDQRSSAVALAESIFRWHMRDFATTADGEGTPLDTLEWVLKMAGVTPSERNRTTLRACTLVYIANKSESNMIRGTSRPKGG